MAVSLSPVGGVAAQFFTSSGAVLTGGKLYTYLAGTTTPATTYTTSAGNTARTNPIVLDSAGRVPSSGEIWLTININYKFVLKDSNDVLIGTYDNIFGGVDSSTVVYQPGGTGAVATTVQAKLRESISVSDFGSDAAAFAAAVTAAAGKNLIVNSAVTVGTTTVPQGVFLVVQKGGMITVPAATTLTIYEQMEAGPYQCFTATGNVVWSKQSVVNAGWWEYLTDAAVAITKAVQALGGVPSGSAPQVRTTGYGGRIELPPVVATAYTTVNLASFVTQYLEIVGTSDSTVIDFNMTGANKLCFDCTGSNHIIFRNFKIRGDATNKPSVGFYFARDVSGGSGLFHYMYDVITSGNFTKAPLYSYGAEECRYYNCYFQQSETSACCFWITGDNAGVGEGVTSVYTSTATGQQSNSDNAMFGCSFITSGTGEFTNAIKIRSTYTLNMWGSFFALTGSAALQEVIITDSACVEADGTKAIIFAGGNPTTPATGTYTISANVITSVSITDSGSGYTSNEGFTATTQSGNGVLTPYAYGPKAFVYLDASAPIASLGINIDGFRMETPTVAQYGVLVTGATSGTISNITIKNGFMGPALATFSQGSLSTVQNLVWENNITAFTSKYGMYFGTLDYAYVRDLGKMYVTGVISSSIIFAIKTARTIAGGSSNNTTWFFQDNGSIQINGTASSVPAAQLNLGSTTQTTIGANGAASALTGNPLGYLIGYLGSTKIIIPYYNA